MSRKSNVVPMKQADPSTDTKLAAIYHPANQRELKSLGKQHVRRQKANPVPRLKVTKANGRDQISIDHPNNAVGFTLLMEAFGTSDPDFAQGLLKQITNVASQGQSVDEDACNFVMSVVTGLEPRDQVEAMLASQMAAIHMATLTFARKLAHVETLDQLNANEKTVNKLARTFTAQVEALKRYRSKGEQRVIVERVTVNEGGQAIVGNVQHGGVGSKMPVNPMYRANAAPRCSATSKRSGLPCMAPAVRGCRVCRFHGARGGAPFGMANGRYVHGRFTCEAADQNRLTATLIRRAMQAVTAV